MRRTAMFSRLAVGCFLLIACADTSSTITEGSATLTSATAAPSVTAAAPVSTAVPSSATSPVLPRKPRFPSGPGDRSILHGLTAWSVAAGVFAPDGKSFATGGMPGDVLLWDVATWKVRRRSPPSEMSDADHLAFLPDGVLLMCGSRNGHLRTWKALDGEDAAAKNAIDLPFGCKGIAVDVVHHEVLTVEARNQGTVVVARDLDTFAEKRKLEALTNVALSAAAGRYVSYDKDARTLVVRSLADATEIARVERKDAVRHATFDPNGTHLALAEGPDVVVLRVEDLTEVHRGLVNRYGTKRIGWSADGKALLATGGGFGASTFRIFRTEPWAELSATPLDSSPTAIAASPDGLTLVSVGSSGMVRFWDTTTGAELAHVDTAKG